VLDISEMLACNLKKWSPAWNLSLTIPVNPVSCRDMTSTWRKHLIICLFLGLLAVPIYFLDVASTQQGGGNWITLDFRGLIFWTYITLLAIHVLLSSIAVGRFLTQEHCVFTFAQWCFP
jgi:hypothetical protein